jgi:pimeloyl-ACP methyl ester carboxylesterase
MARSEGNPIVRNRPASLCDNRRALGDSNACMNKRTSCRILPRQRIPGSMRPPTLFSFRAAFYTGVFALVALAGSAAVADDKARSASPPAGVRPAKPSRAAKDVLLVHGAFADGSSWSGVTKRLQHDGYTVRAVQLREQSVADDAALVRHAIGEIPRPVVVVGHSYGGIVVAEATTGAANVVGLVYVAGFALDQGETIKGMTDKYPPAPAFKHLIVDDQGNATLDPADFVQHFAADEARAMETSQHPISISILGTPAGVPAWKTIPSFYQVSTNDEVLDPNLQRFFAKRMGAHTTEIAASHVPMVSKSGTVAELIERAAGKQ